MAYQQKEGQGSLFKNDKQNDRQPDFRGNIMIKGVLYEVAAWSRTSQNGREYISLQASEPDPNRQASRQGGNGSFGGSSYGSGNGGASYGSNGGASYGAGNGSNGAPYGGGYSGASYGQQGGWNQSAAPQSAPAPTMDDFPGDNPEDLPF